MLQLLLEPKSENVKMMHGNSDFFGMRSTAVVVVRERVRIVLVGFGSFVTHFGEEDNG